MKNRVKKTRSVEIGHIESFRLFEVAESELESLEKGAPSPTHLALATVLLSAAGSFLAILLSDEELGTATVFIVTTLFAFALVAGLVLLISWYKRGRDLAETVRKIKARLKTQ